MNEPNLIILAAGISSRMKESSDDSRTTDEQLRKDAAVRPKSLIRLGKNGRPFLDYVLAYAYRAGYKDVVLVVGENNALMRENYGSKDRDNDYHGLSISYATQAIPAGRVKPLGTADAVLCGAQSRPDWEGAQFTVCNSDNLYSIEALTTLRTSPHPHALIAYDTRGLGFKKDQEYNNAILEKDQNGFLSGIVEKPGQALFEQTRAERGYVEVSMNIFRFSYDRIVPFLEATPVHAMRKEKEIPTTISLLLADQTGSIYCYGRNEPVPDLTREKDITVVQKHVFETFKGDPFEDE
jgi:glucose-1-phosphate adenylyltransferase